MVEETDHEEDPSPLGMRMSVEALAATISAFSVGKYHAYCYLSNF